MTIIAPFLPSPLIEKLAGDYRELFAQLQLFAGLPPADIENIATMAVPNRLLQRHLGEL